MAAEKIKSLPLCTGLLNEQLPRASHPSWVLGTRKALPAHLTSGAGNVHASQQTRLQRTQPVGAIIEV